MKKLIVLITAVALCSSVFASQHTHNNQSGKGNKMIGKVKSDGGNGGIGGYVE